MDIIGEHPVMTIAAVIASLIVISVIAALVGPWLSIPFKVSQGGAAVVASAIDPVQIQQKYEWFKDASAKMDSYVATAQAKQAQQDNLKSLYGNISFSRWNSNDRQQYEQWDTEKTGILGAYNNLAAQYNADMAKWNYEFCNQGSMPKGLEREPALPREYRPYVTSISDMKAVYGS